MSPPKGCINHLTITDRLPDYNGSSIKTPLESPDSVLFFLLPLKRFLSVPSFWGEDGDRSGGVMCALWEVSAWVRTLPGAVLSTARPHPCFVPSSVLPHSHFEFVCCALNFIYLWFLLTSHKWGPLGYLFSNMSFSLMSFMTLQKLRVSQVVMLYSHISCSTEDDFHWIL